MKRVLGLSLFLLSAGLILAQSADQTLTKLAVIDDPSFNVQEIDNFDSLLICIKQNGLSDLIDSDLLKQYAFIKHYEKVKTFADAFDFNKYAQGLKQELLDQINSYDLTKTYKFRLDLNEISGFDFDKNAFRAEVRGRGGLGIGPSVSDITRFGNVQERYGNILIKTNKIGARSIEYFWLSVVDRNTKVLDSLFRNTSYLTEKVTGYVVFTVQPVTSVDYKKYMSASGMDLLSKSSRRERVLYDGSILIKPVKAALFNNGNGKIIGYLKAE